MYQSYEEKTQNRWNISDRTNGEKIQLTVEDEHAPNPVFNIQLLDHEGNVISELSLRYSEAQRLKTALRRGCYQVENCEQF